MNWHLLALISIGIAVGIYLYDYLNGSHRPLKDKNFDLMIVCIVVFLIAAYIIFTENIEYPF